MIVEFRHPRSQAQVSVDLVFQVDTGADSTTLFNLSMLRLAMCGIMYDDLALLPEAQWCSGILGERLPTYSLPAATLVFKTLGGPTHKENVDLRVVRVPARDNNNPYACPPLLGMNIIERFDLCYDGPHGVASARRMIP